MKIDTILMRKSIIEMAVLLLVISVASAQPFATDFGVNDASGDPNTFVLVPVNITNVQNESIGGIIFDITFDPSVINLTKDSVQKGDLTSAWDSPMYNPANGRISLVFGGSGTEISKGKSGSVAILNFSVVGSPGAKSAMNISRIQFGGLEGAVGTASANNGTFRITGSAFITSIKILPLTKTLAVGAKQTFNAKALDQKDDPIAGINITFTSDNITVGTVYPENMITGADGIATTTFTALENGEAKVTAANSSVKGKANVIVSPHSSQLSISFTNPTPENGAVLAQDYADINTEVSNASTAFIDWNRSLVGWWRFNIESGESSTFFRDWSTWENNATCSGTNCPASTSGKFGNALGFDGVNDYLDAGNASSLDITGNLTIEAWVKPERLETAHIVKKASRDSTDGYELSLSESTGKAYFRVNQNTSHNTYKLFSKSSYPLDGNTWVHLVGVYNRAQVQIYFNGNLENNRSGPAKIISNTDNLKIGGPDLSRYFNGTIDEVRIWNRALSPEEIKASYDAGIYKLYRNFTNLPNEDYNYQAYAQNLQGKVKQTKKRTLTLISQE